MKITNELIDFYELDNLNCIYDVKRDVVMIHDVQLIEKDWRKRGVTSESLAEYEKPYNPNDQS